MLDPKFIRKNPDIVQEAIRSKRERVDFARYLELDARRRDVLADVEKQKHARNVASREIGRVKKAGGDATERAAEARALGESIKDLDAELSTVDEELDALRRWIPNVPHATVPRGDQESNTVLRTVGAGDGPPHGVVPHHEIGERLGILDTKRASRLSGSGFAVLLGDGARLARALSRFMLDLHTREHGYVEVMTPFLALRECLFGTGQLPKLEEDMYRTEPDDLFLIPTAEVTITNLHRGDTFSVEELPVKLCGLTACFRREAGAYGKDTRGLMRVHQFDKVELVQMVEPESSYDALESLVAEAAEVLVRLEIPHRVSMLATGDLSFAAAKCYDIEAYAPAEDRWLEVSSCSNFEAFQARRIGIRYKKPGSTGSELVHTLNGSGLALPRVMIALIENHQTARGTVRIPSALVAYMDGQEEIGPRE